MKRKKPKFETWRTVKKKRKKRLNTIIYSFVVLALLIGSISFASFAGFVSIQNVTVKGLVTLPEEKILAIFKRDTQKKWFWLLSKSNIFLYPKSTIQADIKKSFENISDVTISRSTLTSIDIVVKERKPFGLWCKDTEYCFYLDDQGRLFDQTPHLDTIFFTTYYGQVLEKNDGKYFLEPEVFKNLNTFIDSIFSVFGVKTKQVTNKGHEISLLLETDTIIQLYSDADLKKTFENLAALIGKTELQTFEHIDLRFGNKIPYKLKSK